MKKQVKVRSHKKTERLYTPVANIEEYNNGVSFGMFHFHEEDDPLLPDNYEHPFNARIIRN